MSTHNAVTPWYRSHAHQQPSKRRKLQPVETSCFVGCLAEPFHTALPYLAAVYCSTIFSAAKAIMGPGTDAIDSPGLCSTGCAVQAVQYSTSVRTFE
jgi:hypothetical protein